MIKRVLYLIVLINMAMNSWAQETADAFLQRVSDRYAQINSFQSQVRIQRGTRIETGLLRYQAPNLLRLDYSSPARQVLVVSDNRVELFLPNFGVVMEQIIPRQDASALALIGTAGNGLRLLRENYFVSYLNGPAPEPLGEGSNEMVIKLALRWRVNAEGFRNLEISVNPQTLMIRRIVGVTSLFETVRFDFTNIQTNVAMNSDIFVFRPEEGQAVIRYPNFLNLLEE